MTCDMDRSRLHLYLQGRLPAAEAAAMQAHIESCEACQSVPVVPPAFAGMLRSKLPVASASVAFESRLRAALGASAPDPVAAPATPPSAWWQRCLASPWMPRFAMAAVLAFLLLVPARTFFRAPALAQEAVHRHGAHAESCTGPLPSCCRDLMLAAGDVLGPPSAGATVPDLRPIGLELVVTSHCEGGTSINLICYRARGGALFSLYMTDQVVEQFQALRPRSERGLPRARYRVQDSDVTLWERDGLVHLWVGPHGSNDYEQGLSVLQPLP